MTDVGNTLEVNGALIPASLLSLTALGSSAAPSALGQPVTLTATVAAANPADGTPTGMVDFVDTTTGADLGTAGLVDGVATLTTSALGLGSHAIVADYEGDGTFAFSSGAVNQTVNPSVISTTTTVASSLNSSVYGQGATFTAAVTPATTGSGTPTGVVQFEIDGAAFGSPVPLVNGSATSGTIQSLGAGTHAITAIYSGATGFQASTAANLAQLVNLAPLTVTANPASKVYGGTDPTLAYTVNGLVNGDPASVVSGVSLLTATGAAATAGTHTIYATGGTAANYAITDVNGTLTVSPAP